MTSRGRLAVTGAHDRDPVHIDWHLRAERAKDRGEHRRGHRKRPASSEHPDLPDRKWHRERHGDLAMLVAVRVTRDDHVGQVEPEPAAAELAADRVEHLVGDGASGRGCRHVLDPEPGIPRD